jgi:hypothetical protein
LDFNVREQANHDEGGLARSHEVMRFGFSNAIVLETYMLDEHHFIVSVGSMRVITMLNSFNAGHGRVLIHE